MNEFLKEAEMFRKLKFIPEKILFCCVKAKDGRVCFQKADLGIFLKSKEIQAMINFIDVALVGIPVPNENEAEWDTVWEPVLDELLKALKKTREFEGR